MRVTVGLPFYNSEQTLADAIRSVFAQTCEDWELLLVDDGSSDGSLDIARLVDDPRVRVISDGSNRGLYSRLNQISELAAGDYIARMDSDDVMHPERLARQVAFLDANPEVDLVGTAVYTIDSENRPTGVRDAAPLDMSPKAVLRQSVMCHPTVTGRADWFRRNPYLFTRAEDYELWCRTFSTSHFTRLEDPLHYYREGARAPLKYLRDYLQTAHVVREILRTHGPRHVGWGETLELIAKSYLKGEAYRLATLLGLQRALIRKRNRPLDDGAFAAAERVLNAVLSTPVPGLSSSEATRQERRAILLHVATVASSLFFLEGQADYMRARGFDVHALSSPGEGLEHFHESEGVPVYGVEMPRRITPLQDLSALRQIYRTVRKVHPDIVHAHTPKGGLLGTAAAWLAGVPIRIYHIHGLPLVTATGYKRVLLRWSERVSCRLATQVLCVSHSLRQMVISEGLCPEGKITVPLRGSINGIDADHRFSPARIPAAVRSEVLAAHGLPDSARVIGFVGRLVCDKGLSELVDAWKILRDRYPDLHVLVIGPFEPRDPVPPETKHVLQTDRRIVLAGYQEDIPPLFTAMDVLALPTYREGFNTTLLEAAAMELPAVASRVPGCVDVVVDGETGTLVPPRDWPALAEALSRYLDDPELGRRHGRAARERVLRDFRREDIWEAVYQVYCRLLYPMGSLVTNPVSPMTLGYRWRRTDAQTFDRHRGLAVAVDPSRSADGACCSGDSP